MQLELSTDTDISDYYPSIAYFKLWVDKTVGALPMLIPQSQQHVHIRLLSSQHSHAINKKFRGKDSPTNVLAFPDQVVPGFEAEQLGELLLCPAIIHQEAQQQQKERIAHWAHLIIHGILHLCGFDHDTDCNAQIMETIEVRLLACLGYPDPYDDHGLT